MDEVSSSQFQGMRDAFASEDFRAARLDVPHPDRDVGRNQLLAILLQLADPAG